MDFTRLHVKVYVIAGEYARETFRDPAHFETVDAGSSGGKIV
jgi:hypothetical protein